MKILIVALLISFLFSLALASPNPSSSNITLGSSLTASLDGPSYLLSPSGTFAFGFKSLDPNNADQYKIGIWIANSTDTLFTWVPNPDHDEPIDKGSSMQLNNSGVFMLRKLGFKEEVLLNVTDPVFSASILDNGNLVLFGNDSNIIWQSFDHPTDTIVEGQILKSGEYLSTEVSPLYHITMTVDGNLVLERQTVVQWWNHWGQQEDYQWSVHWNSKTVNKGSRVVLKLDRDGRLYLVDWNLNVIKNFTKGEEKQVAGRTIYRATMDSDGIFRVYGERMGSEEDRKSVVLWEAPCLRCQKKQTLINVAIIVSCVIVSLAIIICFFYWCCRREMLLGNAAVRWI
ncbi:hypothetical protein ACHQM5_011637 [Ranunculus cassubicifolius]